MAGEKNRLSLARIEAVIILNPDLDEAGVAQQLEKVSAVVAAHAGSIISKDVWGRRNLSYKIKKRSAGIYTLLVVEGDNSLVADLDRQLKINEQVLRHMLVRKDRFAPDLSKRRSEEEAALGFLGTGGLPASEEEFEQELELA